MAKTNQHPIKTVVSLSGGIDSTTLLAKAIKEGEQVQGVFFLYPSKHGPYEKKAAVAVANYYKIPLDFIDVRSMFDFVSSDLLQSGGPIPEGHYQEKLMRKTIVPGRNLIFLSILAAYAESRGIDRVAIAIHSGDHAIYPDCRPRFFHSAALVISFSTEERVKAVAPYLHCNKEGIINQGLDLGVPYHLTRTCYKEQELACGKCGSCVERLGAFKKLETDDPIRYERE